MLARVCRAARAAAERAGAAAGANEQGVVYTVHCRGLVCALESPMRGECFADALHAIESARVAVIDRGDLELAADVVIEPSPFGSWKLDGP